MFGIPLITNYIRTGKFIKNFIILCKIKYLKYSILMRIGTAENSSKKPLEKLNLKMTKFFNG